MGSGTNVYIAAGNYLSAIVHALDSTGRFKVISRPMVFTSNNKKAIIASGTEIPVPVSTISSTNNGSILNTGLAQQSNIQFKKVALQLEVVPLINSEKEVTLDILQKVDNVGWMPRIDKQCHPEYCDPLYQDHGLGAERRHDCPGRSDYGQQARQPDRDTGSKSHPIGWGLFRSTNRSKTRSELIILMRPEVALTKLDLYRMRQKTEDRTHFGPELEQDDCPDCPPKGDGKQLPPPDLPRRSSHSRA